MIRTIAPKQSGINCAILQHSVLLYLFNWHMYSPLDCIPAVCSIHFSTAPKPSIWIYGYKSNTNYCNSIKRCLWVGFRHKKSLINTEVYNRHVCEVHLWIFVDNKINTKVIVLDSFADMLGAKKKQTPSAMVGSTKQRDPQWGPKRKPTVIAWEFGWGFVCLPKLTFVAIPHIQLISNITMWLFPSETLFVCVYLVLQMMVGNLSGALLPTSLHCV